MQPFLRECATFVLIRPSVLRASAVSCPSHSLSAQIACLAVAFNLLSNCDFKASIFVALICVLVCTFAPQLFLDPCSQAEPATLDKIPLLTKMAPSVSDVRPSATSTPVSKLAQTTPDDKTTEDPRDDNLRRAIASHTFGGAANLRDVFTNQGE